MNRFFPQTTPRAAVRALAATAVLAAALTAPLPAMARDLPTAAYLPLNLATQAAQAAVRACATKGYAVSAAVAGRDGAIKVLLKADQSGPHTGASAQGKAYAAAALGRDTAGLADFIAAKPANAGMRDMDPRLVIQAGGVPIKFGSSLVAGLGVGGAPSGDIDALCAVEGLKAIDASI